MSDMSDRVGELRPSQFITTFGPGAIVDLPNYSVIMAGTDQWDNLHVSQAPEIKEDRLKKKLGIKQIKSIPTGESISTLPAYRFPGYHVCPNCRKLGTRNGRDFFEEKNVLYCKNPDNGKEEPCPTVKTHPVRFITACKKGHIDDFPWSFYVHQNDAFDSKECKLYLEDKGETGSLKDLIVSCKTCKKKRSISDALSEKNVLGHCSGKRPWLNDCDDMCEEQRKLLLRGASNIYFSVVESSIVIPQQTDSDLRDYIKANIDFTDKELVTNRKVFDFVNSRKPDIKRLGLDKVWKVVQQLKDGTNTAEIDDDLRRPEYNALLTEQYNYEHRDFEVEAADVPERFSGLVSNLIQVKRLKEVMVLRGFTRIHPAPDVTERLSSKTEEEELNNAVEMAPISADKDSDWLPGVETYGEGIFLTLNTEKLDEWEETKGDYAAVVEGAHQNMYKERDVPEKAIPPFKGLRYVLLHTLSHALIRELTLHSGYSSSALKERIYSDKEAGMAGILIYTSTVDSEGSLGGLVELGNKAKFEAIMARALAAAGYCSGDPQCGEYDEHTLTNVNGAACHSCMLISEISCESSNRYLDRALLVETIANKDRAFFGG